VLYDGKETLHEAHWKHDSDHGRWFGYRTRPWEALHKCGNQVIISGRRKSHLGAVVKANPGSVVDEDVLVSTVNTNLLGAIRITSALIEHLKRQPAATVIYNTSVLGYVPLAMTAVYSATKAALHSYILSQRYKLKNTTVSVLEIAPPWVQTDLMGSNNEPRAMPLAEFIKETIDVLGTDAQEVLVERAKPLRNNPGPNEGVLVAQFNDSMFSSSPEQ
jgi:uncharacterized oxidoreductase